MNLEQYLPFLLFLLVGLGVGIAPMAIGWFFSTVLGFQNPDASKTAPYECAIHPSTSVRMKFDVRSYLVAILFFLFDLEIAFLFPWAVALGEIGAMGFWSVMVFLAILVVGFVYEWKKGALDWE